MPLDLGSLAPIIGGTSLGNGLAIDSRVIRGSLETLTPVWNWSTVLVENPQILAPQWVWTAAVSEAMTFPKTGKIHTVRSTVRLVSNSND